MSRYYFGYFTSTTWLRAKASAAYATITHFDHFSIFNGTICLAFQTESANTSHLYQITLHYHANEFYVLEYAKKCKNCVKPPHSKGENLKTLHFLPKNGVLQGCLRCQAKDHVA